MNSNYKRRQVNLKNSIESGSKYSEHNDTTIICHYSMDGLNNITSSVLNNAMNSYSQWDCWCLKLC
jgi:hypothetical protein